MYNIQFTRMNCLWLGNKKKGEPDQRCVRYTACGSLGWTICVEAWEQKGLKWTRCVWYEANRSVIENVCEDRSLQKRLLLTSRVCCEEMIAGIKLWVIDEKITDGFHCVVCVRCDILCPHNIYALSTEHQHIYLKRQHCITKLSIQLHKWIRT